MKEPKDHTVAILGASDKAGRFSNKAVRLLKRCGYRVIPVHPKLPEIEGLPVRANLDAIEEEVDTLTLYVEPLRSQALVESIASLKPRRVIFNPGTENPDLESFLTAEGIPCVKACTLVMLRTGQF